MGFKEKLKELRQAQRLKQQEVANVLNYGYTAIANYENGRNEPSMADLIRLADYFQISLDELLERNYGMPKDKKEKLVHDFDKLTQEQQDLLLALVAELVQKG